MKPRLPALVMPLSTVSGSAQAGSTLQRRATRSDGGRGADAASAASSTVYIDGARHGPAGSIPSYAPDATGFKRRHASLNVRTRKKRFG